MERRGDLIISTLRGYIEGRGGTLRLVVEFPDPAPVQIAGIGQLGGSEDEGN